MNEPTIWALAAKADPHYINFHTQFYTLQEMALLLEDIETFEIGMALASSGDSL